MLSILTANPSLASTATIDPAWFPKAYQPLVEFINEGGNGTSYFELRAAFDRKYPRRLSREAWEPLLESHPEVSIFDSWVRILRGDYYHEEARRAADEYARNPSDDNLAKVIDAGQAATANSKSETKEKTLADLAAEMELRITDPESEESGIKTYPQLDSILGDGIRGGQLITIGARPAVGKSAFALNLCLQALQKQPDLRIDLFSLEMAAGEVYQRAVSVWTKIQNKKLIHPLTSLNDSELKSFHAANAELPKHDLGIHDQFVRLPEIIQKIQQRSSETPGKYIAIVDYLGLVNVPGQPERRLQIEQVTRELKVTTQQCHIPIIMLSQLSRAIAQRSDKRPELTDLRDSGSVEQDSNVVGFLFNDDDQQANQDFREVTLAIAKNREGALGDINFHFHADQLIFQVAYS